MGDHKFNGNAIRKAQQAPMPSYPPGAELYSFEIETALELNAESMAIIDQAATAARLSGEDERRAVHNVSVDWSPKETPERFDLVAYKRWGLGRPSPLLPDPRQVPTVKIRHGEIDRIPLPELQARANAAFEEAQGGDRQVPS